MKLSQLFESEESDRNARLEARIVYIRIKQFLDENSSNLKKVLKPISSGNLNGRFMLPQYAVSGLQEDYPDLIIVFGVNNGHIAGGCGFHKGHYILYFNCLLGKFNTKFLNTRFSERDFMHEFNHYLLNRRTKELDGTLNAFDTRAYFNNPHETN